MDEDLQKPRPTVFTNKGDMKEELIKWAEETERPALLNTGELSDSFLDVRYLEILFKTLAFNNDFRKRHTLLFLTKSGMEAVKALDVYPALKNFIVSFSISTNAAMYELGAPPIEERLAAALKLTQIGWRIRLRIDPLIPENLSNKPVADKDTIEKMVEINPERITLGSLRFSHGWRYHNMLRQATSESDHCGQNKRAFKMRLPSEQRIAMYLEVIEALRTWGYQGPIGVCKETVNVYYELDLDASKPICNCSLFEAGDEEA